VAGDSSAQTYAVDGVVYGCLYGSNIAYPFGGRACLSAPGETDPVTLNGELAAYGLHRCGVDTSHAQVVVRRLTDGSVLVNALATTAPGQVEGYQRVASLVLSADGGGLQYPNYTDIQVLKVEPGGETQLDSGPGIDQSSLRLSGSTLTWSDGGLTRTATLG
jgi:hypothetical protein